MPRSSRRADFDVSSGSGGEFEYAKRVPHAAALLVDMHDCVAAACADPLTVLYPDTSEIFQVGQEIEIAWYASADAPDRVNLYISPNSGIDFLPINKGSIAIPESDTFTYTWTVDDSLDGISLASNRCYIMVQDYNEGSGVLDISNSAFTIRKSSAINAHAYPSDNSEKIQILNASNTLIVQHPRNTGRLSLALLRPNGSKIASWNTDIVHRLLIPQHLLPSGYHVLKITTNESSLAKLFYIGH
ncbi:MAG: hypothetical protein GF398_20000 [Chitinivibrionales bacterium]|nr:hypothetical protein [Chitinivibrionales bacterium]